MIVRSTRRVAAPPRGLGTPSFSGQRLDNSPIRRLAVWLFWLLTARLIIPGFFDYGQNVDLVAVAQQEALFNRITWLLFLGAGSWMVLTRMSMTLRVLRYPKPAFLALLILATCSVTWSMNPAATILRLSHVGVVLLACVAVTIYGWHERRFQEVV